jgi:acetyl-CoA C-acetyltransferase
MVMIQTAHPAIEMRGRMSKVVIVEAVRSPIGRRNGGLSGYHSASLLADLLRELMTRSGIDPGEVGQVVGGCVGQVGMQTMNVARTAWLIADLPLEVPATTIDTQCGSSQQATTLAYSLIASGLVDVAVACGVELMSRVPIGSTVPLDPDVGKAIDKDYWEHYEYTSQFEGAERIADKWGITRDDCDAFGKSSQDRAADAWQNNRFDSQVVPINVPRSGPASGSPAYNEIFRDEGLRETALANIANLKPVARPGGVHTAASSSQISDGAAALLLMSGERARDRGITPLAEIVDTCLVGCDPVLMLEGPIPATQALLSRSGLRINDIDLVEINEAFASVVLAWLRNFKPDPSRINPNGGAIALGHPLGATGAVLITKAVHEMVRANYEQSIVTMCCGGGLGTGTLLRRV